MRSGAIAKVEGALSWKFGSQMAVGTIGVAEVGLTEDGDGFMYRLESPRAEPG